MKYRIAFSLPAAIALSSMIAFAADTKTNVTIKSGASTNETTKSTEPIKVTAVEAKEHVGANAVVTGTIAEVNRSPALIRLNFEQPYPKNVFTAVIFARSTNEFAEVEKMKGKKVQVSGKIAEYRGHPQIVLTSTNQVKVVEKPAEKKNN